MYTILIGTGRLYVFYTYNIRNTTHWPRGGAISNSNLLGGQFYRYSDDAGMTWSNRTSVSIRNTTIDLDNPFAGALPMGWSVGKPFISSSGTAVFQYTKIGCPPGTAKTCEDVVSYDEAWLFASDDITGKDGRNTEPTFQTLPTGDVGLHSHNRTANGSTTDPLQWIAEEGDVVEMGAHKPSHLYYAYRTSDGYLGVGTSIDGGRTFPGPPQYALYQRVLAGCSGRLKNPRGPITPRRLSNGRYLLLYFNRANGGIEGSRNPYWLAAGMHDPARNTIFWSQPELILYTSYATSTTTTVTSQAGERTAVSIGDPVGTKLGYPDLFEFSGNTYMTETDKITARLHKFEPDLIEALLQQGSSKGQPAIKPLLSFIRPGGGNVTESYVVPSPFAGIDISAGGSITIEAWIDTVPKGSPALSVITCGTINGAGPLLHFFAPGAWAASTALTALFRHTAAGEQVVTMTSQNLAAFSAATPGPHQVVLVVDGLAQVATFFVDGVLLDGDTQDGTGFFELAVLLQRAVVSRSFLSPSSSSSSSGREKMASDTVVTQSCDIGGSVRALRVYGVAASNATRGYLRTSEVVASFLDGLPTLNASVHAVF